MKRLTRISLLLTLMASACQPIDTLMVLSEAPVARPEVRSLVNNATYSVGDAAPATAAYRAVAEARGWSQTTIDRWQPFIVAVMRRESGFCPNVRGGAKIGNPTGCVIARQGRRSDSGFGQVISIHYRQGAWLCKQEALCSSADITGSAWNSMTAFLALVERVGQQGWCYTSRLRRGAVCRIAPLGKPLT
jgi:hypothetical protein